MITNTRQLKAIASRAGSHFFDKEARRFFRSHIHSAVYGNKYFVTSEQHINYYAGIEEARKYTVRAFTATPDNFDILSASEFQEFDTSAEAHAYARKLAGGRA